jgi:hypothetical protein
MNTKDSSKKISEGIQEVLSSMSDEMKASDAEVISILGEFGAFTVGNAIGRLVQHCGREETIHHLTVLVNFLTEVHES